MTWWDVGGGQKGGGWHFFKKGGDTCQVGDDLKRRGGDPTPWDSMKNFRTLREYDIDFSCL